MDLTPLWLSLRIATIATTIALVLGIAIAYWRLGYQGRWRSLVDSLLLAPMVLPPTVLGFGLLLLLGKNGPLGRLGFNLVFTSSAAVLTATVVGLPLMYKTLLGAFRQIDPTLPQAARTLCASEMRILVRILLPLARPGILSGITLTFARALGEFGATLMLAGNIPGKTQTLPMAIYFAVEAGAFREAAFWSGIILLITLGGLMVVNHAPRLGIVLKGLVQRPALIVGWVSASVTQHNRCRCWISFVNRNLRTNLIFSLQILRRVGNAYLFRVPANSASSPSNANVAPQLVVDIYKRLPGFTLQVAFHSDRQPLGLLGASGAGKSLILRCLAGLETPDAGRIILNGRVLFDAQQGINLPSRDRQVGLLWQNYALFPHLTVAENVAFGLPAGCSAAQRHQQITQQLKRVQLLAWRDRYPHQLSGGQQQRVALARMLASQPELLLFDEPFSALDTHLRNQVEQNLQHHLERFPGITLLVSHNIDVAYRFCPRLLVMVQGKAEVCAARKIVLEQPPTVGVAQLTGYQNITPIAWLGSHTVMALAWHCTVQVAQPLDPTITHLALRGDRIRFIDCSASQTCINSEYETTVPEDIQGSSQDTQKTSQFAASAHQSNIFPCWLVMTSETPQHMTLYLKLQTPPTNSQDYHLQAEISQEKWHLLQSLPLPWSVQLPPENLLPLRS